MNGPASPLVTVCVATYHQDRYIEDCLNTVLAQSGDVPLEVLVGDDGCSPETPRIVERLSRRYPGIIQYFRHQKNLGPSANYQFLVGRATGKYIAHLDGDDYWLPGKLKAQTAWLDAHPDSPATYANAAVIDSEGVLIGVFSSDIHRVIDLPFLLERGNFLNHSSMLYRASCRGVVLGIEGPFIDYRMHLGFARQGGLGFDHRVGVVYRHGSEHSMVQKVPEIVRELYFDAVNSVLLDPRVSDVVRRRVLVHFLADIMFGSMVQLRLRSTLLWCGRIRERHPRDYRRAVLGAVGGSLWKLIRAVARKLGLAAASGLRVMHER